jgi:hypothetical protein
VSIELSKVIIIDSPAFFESLRVFFRGNSRIIVKKITKGFELNLGGWEFKALSEDR